MPRKAIDLSGKRFGKLVVVEQAGLKNSQMMWKCKCDCGNDCIASGNSMRRGKTVSCGCVYRQSRTDIAYRTIAVIKHGDSFNRLYFIWNDIKSRCGNPNNISYPNYGGRGIAVCQEWRNDYLSFKKWALDNGYDETAQRGICTIDRINVSGDYSPENCRWVTMRKQCSNKTNTPMLEINGVVHSPSEWAEITGLPRALIYSRYRRGWTGEELISPQDQHRIRHRNK